MFAAVVCPHEGHHTGDQLGADHVQLSLEDKWSIRQLLIPSTLSSHPVHPPSLLTPQCVYLTLKRAKKHFECLYRFGHRTRNSCVWWQLTGNRLVEVQFFYG